MSNHIEELRRLKLLLEAVRVELVDRSMRGVKVFAEANEKRRALEQGFMQDTKDVSAEIANNLANAYSVEMGIIDTVSMNNKIICKIRKQISLINGEITSLRKQRYDE